MEYYCGGVWISVKFAMTTAYCLTYHHDISHVGQLDQQNKWPQRSPLTYEIRSKFYFPNYTREGVHWFENDIGLVRVDKSHYWQNYPRFMKSWQRWGEITTKPVLMHGFGRTENGDYSTFLKYMTGRLHLKDSYSQKNCDIPAVKMEMAFCMEPMEPFDEIDNGDMGNVVYYDVKDPENYGPENRVILGIVSFKYGDPRNIILTNVSYYEEWIRSTIIENPY
ncbi:chymotrypsin-2-like [Culicoides brevitarsis]|uniref:chymotrypsin-2-like n=1 Tax=Culicoides brevitarsis TaxID=469753 RepID=UPI00307B49E1